MQNPVARPSVDLRLLLERRLASLRDSDCLDSRRLLHGRGGCYASLEQISVDLFWPVLLVTFYKPESGQGIELQLLDAVLAATQSVALSPPLQAVCVQRRYQPAAPLQVLQGEVPPAVQALRCGQRFELWLDGRQNCGFFLDMEPGRRWLEGIAEGKRVLNLFAYTCAFSVVAQCAGASEVVNVDMSRSALQQGRRNHALCGHGTHNIQFLALDVLKSWGRIRRAGPFDVAVVDPPSYQPGSFVATRDYGKLLRRVPEFLAFGGDLLLCLNAPELGQDFLLESVAQNCPGCEFVQRLPASADFPDLDPERQLKLMHFRLRGDGSHNGGSRR